MTADDYLRQLQALLPPGSAWPRDAAATLTRSLRALAEELARIDSRAALLVFEADPRETVECLLDWERVAGLPDIYSGNTDTVQARRAAIHSRVAGRGGQTPGYFIALAAALGYEVTVSEFGVFRAGSRAGDSLGDEASVYVWRVNAPTTTVRSFRVGRSVAGERLRSWGNELLERAIQRVSPAHTILLFGYGG